MTRINAGVRAKELPRQALLAEHRELKRIPNKVASGKFNMIGQPKQFKLGTGHVKFFYDKMNYLYKRYQELYDECIRRGYNVKDYTLAFAGIPTKYWNIYEENQIDREIVLARLKERGHKLLKSS